MGKFKWTIASAIAILAMTAGDWRISVDDRQNNEAHATEKGRGASLLNGHPKAKRVIQQFGGAGTYEAIQNATSAAVTRLGKRREGTTYATASVSDYSVIGKGQPVDAESLWRFKHALVAPRGSLK